MKGALTIKARAALAAALALAWYGFETGGTAARVIAFTGAVILAVMAVRAVLAIFEIAAAAPDRLPETCCGRCWHWGAAPSGAVGDCRLDPPRPAPDGLAVYPETRAGDLCQQFRLAAARNDGAE